MTRNGYQHMVHDAYVQQVRQLHYRRRSRLDQVATRSDAETYQQRVREAIRRAFSPWPERTPLNARVTGEIALPAFRIENVVLESRPGCLVTANLYVPNDLQEPAPCVLGTCGHSEAGKASDFYQGFCQRLAHCGFMVLIYDPFSQGERDQYPDPRHKKVVGWGTGAHNMVGKQLELVGEFFGMWRAWDGIRALDYLLSRPEVDPARVGLTGNSGGGTMATWLWAIEDRFTMAAPSCFVTTFLHNLENELPGDAEQCPPGVLGDGLEMADFLIAAAPKPVILMGQNYDYFDRRGLREAYADVERFYEVLGVPPGSTSLFVGPQGHGYSEHNQQAMIEFFARHANVPLVQVDEIQTLAEDALFATPQGDVLSAGATPVYEMVADIARKLERERHPLEGAALKAQLGQLLALPDERGPAHYRVLRPVRKDDELFARFAVETEGDVRGLLWKRLAQGEHPSTLDVEPDVHLYLPHVSAEADLTECSPPGELLPPALSLHAAVPLYALDVRGLGESLPEEQRPGFFQPYGMDYMFHAYGSMLGQSYLGRRVYDALRVMDLLLLEGARAVQLSGRGQGALIALFAALFQERVTLVTLKNGPLSFMDWVQAPYVTWPAANCLRGVLQVCDIADCIRVLGDRVRVIDPWGPEMMLEQQPFGEKREVQS